jgi:hypothetical protein
MNRRDLLAALGALGTSSLALPAHAETQIDSGELLVKLPNSVRYAPQGIWQFYNKKILMTQDVDGNAGKGKIRFSLLSPSGDVEDRWVINYGTHGQSLYASWDGDGFFVYTEHVKFRGLAEFQISQDLSEMKFRREIEPKTAKGESVAFHTYGVDRPKNLILTARLGKGRVYLRYYDFNAFIKGKAIPMGDELVIEERPDFKFGWLQGAGTYNRTAYLLVGDNSKKTKKRIVRIAADGSYDTIFIKAGRSGALFSYEPEALYVQNGRLIYAIYDHLRSHLYTLPVS